MTEKTTGRPLVVLTDEQVAQVEVLAAYLPIEKIADYLGISETTFHLIKNRDERVFKAYKKGAVSATVDIATSLIQKAKEGDLTAQIFYLKTRAGWSEKQVIETASIDTRPRFILSFEDDGNQDLNQFISNKA